MNAIQEGTDECSLSGSSFPSLDRIHLQEEGGIDPNDPNQSSDDVDGIDTTNDADGSNANGRNHAIQDNSNDGEDDDGYPTDEYTIPSLAQPKAKEPKRLVSILKLPRSRLAKKKAEGTNDETGQAPDDSSFLDNVDVADVENKLDDSSFLADAAVDDAHDDFESIGNIVVENEVDSYYDVHASTLSRASASTRASTIGDKILKESNMAAHRVRNDNALNKMSKNLGDDSQSASTYSYGRAYENATLGSYYTSTCSTLTDEYCFDAKKNGVSFKEAGHINRTASGPVDADTGAIIPKSDDSREESLALPPPRFLSNHSAYENPEHLARIVSFGEGEGYVDEQTTRKFAPSDERGGFCRWFVSSSRVVKVVVMFSMLLLVVSAVALLVGLLLPKEESIRGPDSSARSRIGNTQLGIDTAEDVSPDKEISLDPAGTPAPAPLQLARPTVDPSQTARPTDGPSTPANLTLCDVGAPCALNGSQCTGGTTETCCDGETLDSFICDCANDGDGNLKYTCFYTDPCLAQSCEIFEPSVSTSSPAGIRTRTPTKAPKSTAPSMAPESEIFTTSAITDTPTKHPSKAPTLVPSKGPTQEPTQLPTLLPTQKPSNQPTTILPTQIPTETPIIAEIPTEAPIKTSTNPWETDQPTTSFPTTLPMMSTNIPTTATTLPPSAPTTAQASTQRAKLKVTKDTYINQTSSMTNYGGETRLRVDGSPRIWSLIAFDTDSVIGNTPWTVLQATLRLYSLDDGSDVLFSALPNANQWTEKGLTWDNMDDVNREGEMRVGYIRWVSANKWYEVDVTDAFADDGRSSIIRTFLIQSASTNGVAFASRERERSSGRRSPELVLTYTADPSGEPTAPILASEPTEKPTPKPSKITTPNPTRGPPKRPTHSPTTSALPTDAMVPTNKSTVPPGCPTTADTNLALKQALMPEQNTASVYIVFPSQDSYVGGGIYSDENYGSAGDLVLDSPTSKVLIEFDLGFIALTKSVVTASLRMFVNSVGNTTQLSIYRLPNSFDWDEKQVTMGNFRIPPMEEAALATFQVSSSDEGGWVNIDINDFIDGSRTLKFVLSASDGDGNCAFASRETCQSSKLLVVTESI